MPTWVSAPSLHCPPGAPQDDLHILSDIQAQLHSPATLIGTVYTLLQILSSVLGSIVEKNQRLYLVRFKTIKILEKIQEEI